MYFFFYDLFHCYFPTFFVLLFVTSVFPLFNLGFLFYFPGYRCFLGAHHHMHNSPYLKVRLSSALESMEATGGLGESDSVRERGRYQVVTLGTTSSGTLRGHVFTRRSFPRGEP